MIYLVTKHLKKEEVTILLSIYLMFLKKHLLVYSITLLFSILVVLINYIYIYIIQSNYC